MIVLCQQSRGKVNYSYLLIESDPLFFCDVVLVEYDNLHAPVKGTAVGCAVGLCGRVLTV